ncbi:hypothetical protein B7486_11260 [cyanobacterium TDX16]|nr:hypothetical protein B7486_11260 [cyanobacterium TDX16]
MDQFDGVFHHVGVAVRELSAAVEQLAALFGARTDSEIVHDPEQGVFIQFVTVAGLRIELLAPAADPCPLDPILKRGVAIYHVAYEVPDLDAELRRLSTTQVRLVSHPKPAVAFGGRRVAFVVFQGMMFELIEAGSI